MMADADTHPAVSIKYRICLSGSCRRRVTSVTPTWQILIVFPLSVAIHPQGPRTLRSLSVSSAPRPLKATPGP
eukprot:1006415-Alexandrium_andersonii.AAC.1